MDTITVFISDSEETTNKIMQMFGEGLPYFNTLPAEDYEKVTDALEALED